jgi:hypothetical protein
MSECAWKPNWEQAKKHYADWWEHRGLVLDAWSGPPAIPPHEDCADPGPAPNVEAHYTDAGWRARSAHYRLSRCVYPADVLPQAGVDIGPGSLALILGSKPGLRYDTVWYWPIWEGVEEPEKLPPIRFNPDSPWWHAHESALKECVRLGNGKYFTGCPDLIENADTLASLRGMLPMLEDMIIRPDWVSEKIAEINRAWFETYDRVYDIIKLPDGGSCSSAFHIWGPGKTAKLQCDCSAMFSPAMFKRFVVPALSEQCEWLDYSLFHLDGEHCIQHLDLLLGIEALDAIEWTPNPKVPPGGDPYWYGMYNKILRAGKSVQAIGVNPDQVQPLLDAVGGKGMFIIANTNTMDEIERLMKVVEPYR